MLGANFCGESNGVIRILSFAVNLEFAAVFGISLSLTCPRLLAALFDYTGIAVFSALPFWHEAQLAQPVHDNPPVVTGEAIEIDFPERTIRYFQRPIFSGMAGAGDKAIVAVPFTA